ncbi:MAG: hypothetical protein IPN69_05455 [Acidobacteria bacterium]|nr:hypothetical protein [Acidobacteriota bacterium]
MSRKTILKIFSFVIFLAVLGATFSACAPSFKGGGPKDIGNDGKSDDYRPPNVVGRIDSGQINESSGIAASRCQPGVLWTHNDSGDGPFIYAIDEKGGSLGTWRVPGAENVDWEDIAAFKNDKGECFLYIGEIGNNELKRSEMKIYRVPEPKISAAARGSERSNPQSAEPAVAIRFTYADGAHEAETLMVHPTSGDIYVLTKSRKDASGVYRIPGDSRGAVSVKKIAEISVPSIPDGLLTGGDISPDGRRVVVCDYFLGYELKLPDAASGFDDIWKAKPLAITLGERKVGESIGYAADGLAIFATSEKLGSPLIKVDRK